MEKCQEPEITPEMIAAGARIIRRFDSRFDDECSLAEEVFSEMLRVAAAPSEDGLKPLRDAPHQR